MIDTITFLAESFSRERGPSTTIARKFTIHMAKSQYFKGADECNILLQSRIGYADPATEMVVDEDDGERCISYLLVGKSPSYPPILFKLNHIPSNP